MSYVANCNKTFPESFNQLLKWSKTKNATLGMRGLLEYKLRLKYQRTLNVQIKLVTIPRDLLGGCSPFC
jgi:hypothetical protein